MHYSGLVKVRFRGQLMHVVSGRSSQVWENRKSVFTFSAKGLQIPTFTAQSCKINRDMLHNRKYILVLLCVCVCVQALFPVHISLSRSSWDCEFKYVCVYHLRIV